MSEIKEVFDMETIEKNPLGEYLLNKGFEKGIEQGIEKGQKRTQIKLAQNLLKDGVEVSDLTELSLSEVELLKEELEL